MSEKVTLRTNREGESIILGYYPGKLDVNKHYKKYVENGRKVYEFGNLNSDELSEKLPKCPAFDYELIDKDGDIVKLDKEGNIIKKKSLASLN